MLQGSGMMTRVTCLGNGRQCIIQGWAKYNPGAKSGLPNDSTQPAVVSVVGELYLAYGCPNFQHFLPFSIPYAIASCSSSSQSPSLVHPVLSPQFPVYAPRQAGLSSWPGFCPVKLSMQLQPSGPLQTKHPSRKWVKDQVRFSLLVVEEVQGKEDQEPWVIRVLPGCGLFFQCTASGRTMWVQLEWLPNPGLASAWPRVTGTQPGRAPTWLKVVWRNTAWHCPGLAMHQGLGEGQ